MKLACIFFLICFSIQSYATGPLWFGVGNLTHNFSSAQNDVKGGTKKLEFGPTVLVGATIPFYFSGSFLSPGIGLSKFFTEDKTSKSEIILQYHINQMIFSSFYLRYGFSNFITMIGGEDKEVELNNGAGTSTFYSPKKTKTAYTSSIDLGGEFVYDSEWTFRVQASFMRFLSSERRTLSHLLTLNHFF